MQIVPEQKPKNFATYIVRVYLAAHFVDVFPFSWHSSCLKPLGGFALRLGWWTTSRSLQVSTL